MQQPAKHIVPTIFVIAAASGLFSLLPKLGVNPELAFAGYIACWAGTLVYALIHWQRSGGRWQPIVRGVVGVALLIALLVLWVQLQ